MCVSAPTGLDALAHSVSHRMPAVAVLGGFIVVTQLGNKRDDRRHQAADAVTAEGCRLAAEIEALEEHIRVHHGKQSSRDLMQVLKPYSASSNAVELHIRAGGPAKAGASPESAAASTNGSKEPFRLT
jgi:hypothetical protein